MSGVALKMLLEQQKKRRLKGLLVARRMDRSRRAFLSGLRQTRCGNSPTKHSAGLLLLSKLSGASPSHRLAALRDNPPDPEEMSINFFFADLVAEELACERGCPRSGSAGCCALKHESNCTRSPKPLMQPIEQGECREAFERQERQRTEADAPVVAIKVRKRIGHPHRRQPASGLRCFLIHPETLRHDTMCESSRGVGQTPPPV
jgi:hypothetical protein